MDPLLTSASVAAPPPNRKAVCEARGVGEQVQLGEVATWFDVAGEGDPVVLLHGGMSSGSAWGLQTSALAAEGFRVFVPDRRGHGRTPDSDAPFTYDAMADETIAFLEEVIGGPAHLVGWSDGGICALLVALRRPELVRRQVLVGTNFHRDGLLPDFDLPADPEHPEVALFRTMYEAEAVEPARWPVFLAKTARLWREEPTLTAFDLERITAPTMVLVGDDDAMAWAHTIELHESIADSQLAVVPGTSHALTLEKPDLVNQLLVAFLRETTPPGTLMPVRRRRGD